MIISDAIFYPTIAVLATVTVGSIAIMATQERPEQIVTYREATQEEINRKAQSLAAASRSRDPEKKRLQELTREDVETLMKRLGRLVDRGVTTMSKGDLANCAALGTTIHNSRHLLRGAHASLADDAYKVAEHCFLVLTTKG